MPHLIHAAFSATCSVLFFAVALLLVIADHDLEPRSHSWLAAPHSMCELRALLCKTVITLADIMLRQYPRVQVRKSRALVHCKGLCIAGTQNQQPANVTGWSLLV
jgi:hypothetical protein